MFVAARQILSLNQVQDTMFAGFDDFRAWNEEIERREFPHADFR
jgi:hypothetical protein